MRKFCFTVIAFGIATLLAVPCANACSRIFWNDNGVAMVTARTLDWAHSFEDYLMVIPRGQEMNGGFEDSPKWTSKYGSLVCTIGPYIHDHYGFDYVDDGAVEGINEKGLAIHGLYMGDTVYPTDESSDLPPVSYMRLGRYFLDNCANVQEAVDAMKKVRVKPVKLGDKELGAHFAVEDPTGDSAIFEFVDGELVIHHGKQYTVMTNEPAYHVHIENLKEYKDFGGTQEMLPGTTDSPDRFIRAATFLSRMKKPASADDATAKVLGIARTIQVPFDADEYGPTWYTSVTDLTNKVFYFDWTQNPNIVWVKLENLDFSEGQPVKQIDPRNPNLVGEVSQAFEPVK
ncbi:linear amide C-N hydrolase [Bremerella sp. P1]|uniref:linear amide C-N hydrolase n=1 Tax=Bremerella sp. P1 TaxID=3026424 RepID=UPI0023688E62|nr:linear amide C-N hydrolase [Bremerella sp. P1]WDI42101.1 linear amide C-N hydrolase [Bremerella sp. P1]